MPWERWDGDCGYCGAPPDAEGPHFMLVCPSCSRDGCDECMPAGRGCACPECEDGDEAEA